MFSHHQIPGCMKHDEHTFTSFFDILIFCSIDGLSTDTFCIIGLDYKHTRENARSCRLTFAYRSLRPRLCLPVTTWLGKPQECIPLHPSEFLCIFRSTQYNVLALHLLQNTFIPVNSQCYTSCQHSECMQMQ